MRETIQIQAVGGGWVGGMVFCWSLKILLMKSINIFVPTLNQSNYFFQNTINTISLRDEENLGFFVICLSTIFYSPSNWRSEYVLEPLPPF